MRMGLRILSLVCFGLVLSWAWRAAPPSMTRGPYLQNVSETAITVVCKTDSAASLTLSYGTRPGPPWDYATSSPSGTTHVFALTGLHPETRYHYALFAGSARLAGGEELFFRTSPPENSRAPFRFLAWGDSGTGSSTQLDVAARMLEVVPLPDLALGLGDLVYDSGQWENYDPRFFRPYAGLFSHLALWPTIGNHEVETESGAPYLDAFYLPTDRGAPGHPSNTERYYSFDRGMAHFLCADSQSSSNDPGSAMYRWISDDLDHARAQGKRWLFAFMHHPPYSHGTHDSDSENDLIALRANLVPLFEAKGVDMLLVGHSHNYERSYLARNDAILQNDPRDYTKIGTIDGTIYLVSGCGGKTGSGSLDHPLMATSYGDVAGFSLIDVSYAELRGYFVERDGRTTDLFTVHKAVDVAPPRIAVVRRTSASETRLSFDEPVKAGTGLDGAENVANYQLSPGASVLAAALDSDQRTVLLTTTGLSPDRVYRIAVLRVADRAGNHIDAAAYFALASGASGTPVVPRGSTWRYFKGSTAPPGNWTARDFDDTSWGQGQAGFGYGDSDDATVLADMRDNYVSVYLRVAFAVNDPTQVAGLTLGMSYDDGFVAFLNGSEVTRAEVPAGQTNTTPASGSHEAAGFEPFDVSAFLGALVAGTNVLAVEGHNSSPGSNDFSLHPELLLELASGGGAPVAVLDSDLHTANSPARIAFSSERSAVAGGSPSARWDFGDGSPTVSGTSVEHLYTQDGIFTAALTIRDAAGLEALDQIPVRIHADGSGPLAVFSASSMQVDPGASVSFNSQNSRDPDGGSVFRLWDFGDPASGPANHSTATSPAHVFAAAGAYAVRLTVTDDEGSMDAQTTQITVGGGSPPPEALFSAAAGGNPLQLTFTDLSTGTITSWSWSFGDGASSIERHPVHTYAQADLYTVVLTVQGPGGSDSETQQIQVGGVMASFTADASASDPLQFLFTDTSTGGVTSWAWDFGDGSTSSEQHPVHTYAQADLYTVTLTVQGPGGSDSETRQIQAGQLMAAFSATVSPTEPLQVSFSDQSSGNVTSWAWDFGDGGTSTEQNPVHTYGLADLYTVGLTVQGPAGSDSETQGIEVGQLMAAFSAAVSPTDPLQVSFSDESTGNVTGWSWDFGDGSSSTQSDPVHTYDQANLYTVGLTVQGPLGSDAETQQIPVGEIVARFSTAASPADPLEIHFTDESTGGATSWSWDLGDGNTSTEQHPVHTYAQADLYTVVLTVQGALGSAADTQQIQVGELMAGFSVAISPSDPFQVSFSDESMGNVTSWSWDFGDGVTSTEQDPVHAYAQADLYTVSLTVQGALGSDAETQELRVGEIVAHFSASFSTSDEFLVSFIDESSGNVAAWSWDFGDGESSTVQDPVHTYAARGTYVVRLTVSGPLGSDADELVLEIGMSQSSGGGGGGGCLGSLGELPGSRGDPSLALALALVLLVLTARRSALLRGRASTGLVPAGA